MATRKTAPSKRGAKGRPAPEVEQPQKKNTEKPRKPDGPILEPQTSETARWIYGVSIIALAAYLLMSIVFYYMHWYHDQDILEHSSLWDALSGAMVEANLSNPCGPIGAMMGYYMVSIFFGVGAVALPVALVLWSLRIFGVDWKLLNRNVRLITATLLIMILLSVSFGFAFGTAWDMFGSGLGGEWGIYSSEFISGIIGPLGTSIALLLLWIIVLIYTNIGIIKSTGSLISRVFKYIFGTNKKRRRVAHRVAPVAMAYDADPTQDDILPPYPFNDHEVIPIPDFEPIEEHATPEQEAMTEGITEASAEPQQVEENAGAEASNEPSEEQMPEPTELINEPIDEQAEPINELPEPIEELPQMPADIEIEGLEQVAPAEPQVTETVNIVNPTEVPLGSNVSLDKGLTINSLVNEGIVEDIDNSLYDPTRELSDYMRPPVELLEDHRNDVTVTAEEIIANKDRIKQTLESFGIKIDHTKATVGPTVTLYEIVPSAGVRISKIKNLEDDIALNLSALGIRIIAPMPGKGTIGIEVPNKDKKIVSMYSVVQSVKFQESKFELPIVLGKTIQNETFVIDLAKMPHLLVAGATGQGKSVGLNAIITSILFTKHPSQVKFVMVDPKKVELTPYAKLEQHFMAKMPDEDDSIITDNQKVIQTLKSLCKEMDNRYNLLNTAQVRNIKDYNDKFTHRRLNPNNGHKFLPYIVVIVDEFADLIMTAGREIEIPIARLAQLGRAAGLHMVIATQRPTTNIITGMIKANFPARIAFRVTSMIDSRTILDQPGANQLIGRGDMLVSTGSDIIRVQCAFADTPEVERITEFISNQKGYSTAYELPEVESESADSDGESRSDAPLDPMFKNIAYFVVQNNAGSTSAIQRRFSIGYNRAGRITDQLEKAGIVGRSEGGSKPREVLIKDPVSLEAVLNGLGIN